MAGNGYRQKESLLKHVVDSLFNSFGKIRKSKVHKSNEVSTISSNTLTEFTTWPSCNLRNTIEGMVLANMKETPSKLISNIIDEVECELDSNCPLEIEEQLDFCLLCTKVDHMEAVELQQYISSEYNLNGKILWESVLGQDVFSAVEHMLSNSSRLLFYITGRCDDNDACVRIVKNLLLDSDNQGWKKRVIPLVSEFDTPISNTFQLIDKLYVCSKLQLQYRFPAIFTEEVRNEKNERAEHLRKNLDNQRKKVLEKLVLQKLST